MLFTTDSAVTSVRKRLDCLVYGKCEHELGDTLRKVGFTGQWPVPIEPQAVPKRRLTGRLRSTEEALRDEAHKNQLVASAT